MYNKQMEDYLANNKMYSFEGARGVRHLEQIATEVCGYTPDYSGVMMNFFQDNPGAIEAVVAWIGKQAVKGDWRENLDALVGPSEEDEVGDLAPSEETAVFDISDAAEPPAVDTGFSLFGGL